MAIGLPSSTHQFLRSTHEVMRKGVGMAAIQIRKTRAKSRGMETSRRQINATPAQNLRSWWTHKKMFPHPDRNPENDQC